MNSVPFKYHVQPTPHSSIPLLPQHGDDIPIVPSRVCASTTAPSCARSAHVKILPGSCRSRQRSQHCSIQQRNKRSIQFIKNFVLVATSEIGGKMQVHISPAGFGHSFFAPTTQLEISCTSGHGSSSARVAPQIPRDARHPSHVLPVKWGVSTQPRCHADKRRKEKQLGNSFICFQTFRHLSVCFCNGNDWTFMRSKKTFWQ